MKPAPLYRATIVGPFLRGPEYTIKIYDVSDESSRRHVVTVYSDSFVNAALLARDLVYALTAEAAR